MEDKILVNDIITINKERSGESYSSLYNWFESYGISTDNYGKRLSHHIENDGVDEQYRCIWVAPAPNGEIVYAIEGMDTKKVFLVEEGAILQYSHTLHSFDSTEQALDTLTRNYHKLILEFKNYKEFIEKNNKAASNNLNDMPELKNGMFGIVKHLDDNVYVPFCVVNDFIVYAEESWDDVKTFDIYGKSEYSEIIRLYKGLKSFDRAKALFDHEDIIPDREELVWRSKED